MTNEANGPAEAVLAALEALAAARRGLEDAVAESLAQEGVSLRTLAEALGPQEWARVREGLGLSDESAPPAPPAFVPTVFLRGEGAAIEDWKRVGESMWRSGWATVTDRNAAFHLIRGGVRVVLADFSLVAEDGKARTKVNVSPLRADYRIENETLVMQVSATKHIYYPRPLDENGALDTERIARWIGKVIQTP